MIPDTGSTARTVYIAGRMHCGSTFLDIVLGSKAGHVSLGEPINGLNRNADSMCACQVPITECEFWSGVERSYAKMWHRDLRSDASWLYRHSDIRKFIPAAFARLDTPQQPKTLVAEDVEQDRWKRYARLNKYLIAAVAKVAGVGILIDSSKEFTRGLLTVKADPEARLIHLTRNPVATVGSYYWRQTQGSRFFFLKKSYDLGRLRFPALMLVAASWTVGLIAGLLIKLVRPSQVLHVSYERFCEDPRRELIRIGSFIETDLSEVINAIEGGESFPVGHNLGGNSEIMGSGQFTFMPNVKGRRQMPLAYRAGVAFCALPGMLLRRFLINER